jgi:RNA polymerase sigma-70 factor (ECF subfamily)
MINTKRHVTESDIEKHKVIFESLFREHFVPMCQYCMFYVKDAEIAEEIVQDLFYKLWLKREDINVNGSPKSYLYVSLRNHTLNYLNRLKIEGKYSDYVESQRDRVAENQTSRLEEKDMDMILQQALAQLPAKRREIFELSRFGELKYSEIAEKLNLSVKTVESQMSKALEQMRHFLARFL